MSGDGVCVLLYISIVRTHRDLEYVMAVVHMATFLVGYWAPLFRVFLCKPKEIQLPGNKEARLSLRSWLAEKFWFRIKTCVRWHFGFGARLFGKHSFRSKPFWIPSKAYFEEWMLAKHVSAKAKARLFLRTFGFDSRLMVVVFWIWCETFWETLF